MAMITVGSTVIKDPSAMTWGLQDISASDAGRGSDLKMYKGKKGQKVTYALEWWAPTPAEASAILTAFDPEYITVTIHDPKTNANITKEFYVSDRTAPYQMWTTNNKMFSKISFTIIER